MEKHLSLSNILISYKNVLDKGITYIVSDTKEIFISYSQLYQQALKILYNLQKHGINKGDELVFQILNEKNFLYLFWACVLGGVIPVPVTVCQNEAQRQKLKKILSILNNPIIVCEKEFLHQVEDNENNRVIIYEEIEKSNINAEPKTLNKRDIVLIQFSSGSTGEPKGVTITNENMLSNLKAILNGANIKENDSFLSWMPLTHDMGLIGKHLVATASCANQYIMSNLLFIRRPLLWIKKAHQHRINIMSSPNFGFRYFLSQFDISRDYGWDLSNVKIIFNGAEPISVEICNQFLTSLSKYNLKRESMFTVYGLAEATVAAAFPIPGTQFNFICIDRRFLEIGTKIKECNYEHGNQNISTVVDLGYPVKECMIRIVNQKYEELDEEYVGIVQISGKNVTVGYYNNPDETSEKISSDGWLDTGDLGFIKQKRLYICGRYSDLIIINGQNIYPHDIERVVEKIQGIKPGKNVATSVYNESVGTEEILLFIDYKEPLDNFPDIADKIKKQVNLELGINLKKIFPIKRIPKTTSGKLQRYILKNEYLNGNYTNLENKINLYEKSGRKYFD